MLNIRELAKNTIKDAIKAPQLPHQIKVVASGLRNPRGFTWGPDGALYVAESGLPSPAPVNFTGRISRIINGFRETVVDGLPVFIGQGDTVGVADVAFLGKRLYAIISAGPAHGHPDFPGGVYRVHNGTVELVANTDAFNVANPPLECKDCGTPADELSNPYSMVAYDCKLYIADGNKDVINVVDPSAPFLGRIARFADFSPLQTSLDERQFVLTGIDVDEHGNFYLTNLSPFPFLSGNARIFRVDFAGRISIVVSGLTLGTGLSLGCTSERVFVTQFAQSFNGLPPFFAPPGQVREVLSDHSTRVVADNLVFPTILRRGPKGLYVSNRSAFSAVEDGEILLVLHKHELDD